MAHPPTFDEKASIFINETELLHAPFDKVLRRYDELAEGLETFLHEVQQKRAAIASLRDESHTLFPALRAMQQRARELGLLQTSTDPAAHLWVASDEEVAPQPLDTQTPLADPADDPAPTARESAAPASPADSAVPEVVVVRGARMKEILTAVGSRPDVEWGSGDVAELLGISRSDRSGRRALRANLHALTERGALERITVEGDSRTYYKARMNWSFV
ncbi:hypothetical protein [Streptomyces sp. NPDC088350]|uniref:hypothetical protein n=1 Tax=Streptomyces sp. NPDC088350 TaxID=3365854 RepID=UPI00383063CD